MSANKFHRHLIVVPEDDPNRQLANGFWLVFETRQIPVLEEAHGWSRALEAVKEDELPKMRAFPERHLVLLIDFDRDEQRLQRAKMHVPADVADRIFILGILTEPEDLRNKLQMPYEGIGRALAEECRHARTDFWDHPLLRHNKPELQPLSPVLTSIIDTLI